MTTFPMGIMQGRLLPPTNGRIQCFPKENWREEFPLAQTAGLQLIEWIYEVHGAEQNPISTDQGIAELKELSRQHGISVRSVCADYFMDRPLLLHPQEGVQRLSWLLNRCRIAGIKRIIVPFVDASRLVDPNAEAALVKLLLLIYPEAQRSEVELHLETDLPPARFASLMALLPDTVFKVNYDSGNSASHGYSFREEFNAYGSRIGSLHIKDRVLGGGTVPLGTGDVDFKALVNALQIVRYTDDVILQVARDQSGNELEWISGIRKTVDEMLQNYQERSHR